MASAGDLFGVEPEQYGRVLQFIMTMACEMQTDGTGWRCEDHLGDISVIYYADTATTRINSITVGPFGQYRARSGRSGGGGVVLEGEILGLGSGVPKSSADVSGVQVEIQQRLEWVFVSGGFDMGETKEAFFMYKMNTNKDMALVMVTVQ